MTIYVGEGTVLEQQPNDASSSQSKTGVSVEEDSNIAVVTAGDTPYTSAETFENLNLSLELLRGLYSEMRFEKPSQVQAMSLRVILFPPYPNLIAQAPIGSGKSTCFLLGVLSRVDPKIAAPQALCVCPTRELAMQNQEVLVKMGKHTGITSVCAVPTDAGKDVPKSRRGPVNDQVVIGTPGTLKKWMSTKVLSMRDIKILVFDEADHMLAQDGFQDDSRRIIKEIKNYRDDCQILLSPTTCDENVEKFIERSISDPYHVSVPPLDAIKQYVVKCSEECDKIKVLKDTIFPLAANLGQSIIFVRNKGHASLCHRQLEVKGYKCTSIHCELTMGERDRVIKEFRTGATQILILISTDVLGWHIDQAQVNLVVNFDLPMKYSDPLDPDYERYSRQIGRCGRFGRKGAAFNLICTDEEYQTVRKIESYFRQMILEVPWNSEDDFEDVLKDAGLA